MSAHYHFYDPVTGLFSGRTVSTNSESNSDEFAQLNALDGTKPIEGHFDPLSQRVDIATGEVVDYQPPQPSLDHEWDATTKRWRLSATAQAALDADAQARAQLEEIDRQSIRALREAALGNADAVALLTTLEAQAVPLRADVIVETPVEIVKP